MGKLIVACTLSAGVGLCALSLGVALGAAGWDVSRSTLEPAELDSGIDALTIHAMIRQELDAAAAMPMDADRAQPAACAKDERQSAARAIAERYIK
jgi:hypothetical protein